jgi:UDP-glucose:(heptosyl)LPS alpha-1,3-glucosyltransferase
MKIALIRKNYRPYGGAEKYLVQVAEGLSNRGHDIHILSADEWGDTGFVLHRIKTVSGPSLLSNLFFSANAGDLLKKERFDCVFSFERTGYQDIYRAGDGCHREWLNKRKEREPLYKRVSFLINPHHHLLLHLEKKTFERSKVIVANSYMVKNDIIKNYSIPREKIHVIYNGVDLQRFHPSDDDKKAAAKYSLGLQDRKVILFAGADLERKGLPALLRAFSVLEHKGIKLVVAGKRAKRRHVELIKRLGIEKSTVLWGPEKNIKKLYTAADIFVMPTIYDPFSNATLEAMASGIPVITTSANGASEIINDGVEGYVVSDPADSDTIAEKIKAVLPESGLMGKEARKRAEHFPIQKAMDEIIRLITNMNQ